MTRENKRTLEALKKIKSILRIFRIFEFKMRKRAFKKPTDNRDRTLASNSFA